MLEKFIDTLSQELHMENLAPSKEKRYYTLPFKDNIDVDISESDESYLFKGVIGPCPEQNTSSFMMKVMEANLFGIGTRGAVIGLNEQENLLTLSLQLDYNSTYKEFKEKLEDFISVVDFWRHEALSHH